MQWIEKEIINNFTVSKRVQWIEDEITDNLKNGRNIKERIEKSPTITNYQWINNDSSISHFRTQKSIIFHDQLASYETELIELDLHVQLNSNSALLSEHRL